MVSLRDGAGAAAGRERPSADPQADRVKRGRRLASGDKAHVGVDRGSGLIRTVGTIPATVNDTVMADTLVCGGERPVHGDGACHTHARERRLKG